MKTNNKVIIDLTHWLLDCHQPPTNHQRITPERPNNKRVRVSRRIEALHKEYHGVVAKTRNIMEKVDDGTTRPQYYEQASSSGDDDGNHTPMDILKYSRW